jgi:hypothetical protein
MADAGYAWGIYPGNEIGTIPYGWDGQRQPTGDHLGYGWVIANTESLSRFNDPLGDLQFLENDEFCSDVVDSGSTSSRRFVIVSDKTCDDGTGLAIQYRGRGTIFTIDAPSAGNLIWEDYPVDGEYKTWRYFQIKVKQITFLEF